MMGKQLVSIDESNFEREETFYVEVEMIHCADLGNKVAFKMNNKF